MLILQPVHGLPEEPVLWHGNCGQHYGSPCWAGIICQGSKFTSLALLLTLIPGEFIPLPGTDLFCTRVCAVTSVVSDTSWPLQTVAHQAPLSMGFSRQEYWSGLPCPPPGESSWPRDQTQVSCIAGGFFTTSFTRKALTCPTTDKNPFSH